MAIEGVGIDASLEEFNLAGEGGDSPVQDANTSEFSWKMNEVGAHGGG